MNLMPDTTSKLIYALRSHDLASFTSRLRSNPAAAKSAKVVVAAAQSGWIEAIELYERLYP